MIDPRTITVETRRISGVKTESWVLRAMQLLSGEYFIVLKDLDMSKSLWQTEGVGLAEDAFDRLRRIALEGEQAEKMAALGARTKLSPGVIKTLVRLSRTDGISMGEMARGIGCDPSYVTALVDDLAAHGLGDA